MAFTVQSLKNKNDTYHRIVFLNTWLKTRENQRKITGKIKFQQQIADKTKPGHHKVSRVTVKGKLFLN